MNCFLKNLQSLHPRQHALFICCTLFLVIACAKSGHQGNKNSTGSEKANEKKPENPERKNYQTPVPLGLIGDQLPEVHGCHRIGVSPKLGLVESSAFVLDAKPEEWTQVAPSGKDPVDLNSQANNDLLQISVAQTNDPLRPAFIALVELRDDAHDADLFLRLGLAQLKSGSLEVAQKRSYRFRRDEVFEWEIDHWRQLDARVAQVRMVGRYIEMSIDRRQLDAVFNQDSWWLEVDLGEEQGSDRMNPLWFASEDFSRKDKFTIKRCLAEQQVIDANLPMMDFLLISDKTIDAEPGQQILELIQHAFVHVQRLLAHDAQPIAEFSVILSSKTKKNEFTQQVDPREKFYRGFYFEVNPSQLSYLEKDEYLDLYQIFFKDLSDALLSLGRQNSPVELKTLTEAFYLTSLRINFSLSHWLLHSRPKLFSFVSGRDLSETIGLKERFDRLEANSFPSEEERRNFERTSNDKLFAFAHLLYKEIEPKFLSAAWFDQSQSFQSAVEQLLSEIHPGIDRLWQGWLDDGLFDVEFSPSLFMDADEDGLVTYLELKAETDPEAPDSDLDGWSDYAELSVGKDPNNRQVRPNFIAADALMGDWQELLPTFIYEHKSSLANSGCPRASQISAYSAIISEEAFLVSVQKKSAAIDPHVKWKLALQHKGIHPLSFLMQSREGEFSITLIDETLEKTYQIPSILRFGRDVAEWKVPLKFLEGITVKNFDSLLVQVASSFEHPEEDACDSSVWFRPLYNK